VKNISLIAIICGALLAVPGCGKTKLVVPDAESDNFKDNQYYQSLMGLNSAAKYGDFLNGLGPADRVKYINRSVEEGPPTRVFTLKAAYERFVSDPNPDVAAAAKDALAKVPSEEEYKSLTEQGSKQ
jgi:hypothetical protein